VYLITAKDKSMCNTLDQLAAESRLHGTTADMKAT
jgi:hypothetical protein